MDVSGFKDAVGDSVVLSMALAIDGVQDAFVAFREAAPAGEETAVESHGGEELERIVQKLNAFYRPRDGDGCEARRRHRRRERLGV